QITQYEVRLRHDSLAAQLHCFLPWQRLRQMLIEAIHRVVMLGTEERHVCEHDQRENRRRCRLGGEHVLIAHANEGLLREWRSQVRGDALDDALRGAGQAWTVFVSWPCEGRRSGL